MGRISKCTFTVMYDMENVQERITKTVNESFGIINMPNPKFDIVRITAHSHSEKTPIFVGIIIWENIEITQSFSLDKIRTELDEKFPNIGMVASVSTITAEPKWKSIVIVIGAIAAVITIGVYLSGLVKFP